MGQAGEHVLAHAGLAHDEHRGIGAGVTLELQGHRLHGAAGKDGFQVPPLGLGHEGQLVVDLLDEPALFAGLLVELGQAGLVPHEGDHQADPALVVKDGRARNDHILAVLELLHIGGRLARAHHLGVQGQVEKALADQVAHILAPQLPRGHPHQIGIHLVHIQGGAHGIGNEDAVGNGVEDGREEFVPVDHSRSLERQKRQKKGPPPEDGPLRVRESPA